MLPDQIKPIYVSNLYACALVTHVILELIWFLFLSILFSLCYLPKIVVFIFICIQLVSGKKLYEFETLWSGIYINIVEINKKSKKKAAFGATLWSKRNKYILNYTFDLLLM